VFYFSFISPCATGFTIFYIHPQSRPCFWTVTSAKLLNGVYNVLLRNKGMGVPKRFEEFQRYIWTLFGHYTVWTLYQSILDGLHAMMQLLCHCRALCI